MKKLISILLTAVLLFGFMTTGFSVQAADEFEKPIQIPEDDSEPDTEVSAEKWAKIEEFMQQISGSGISFRLPNCGSSFSQSHPDFELCPANSYAPDFFYYMPGNVIYQNAGIYSWENDYILQSSNHNTISTHGCALTSFAMALNIGFGYSTDPGAVNIFLDSHDCDPSSFSCNWRVPYGIKGCDMYTVGSTYSQSEIESIIASDMQTYEKGFIVRLEKGSSTHYVFACGYDDASGLRIYINDPWYPRNYSWLDTYYSHGWSMTSARLFH